MKSFDRMFVSEIPFIYNSEHLNTKRVKVFQRPDLHSVVKRKPTPLPLHFLDSFVTVDRDGFLHSFSDLPALITPQGNLYWYNHGKLHRGGGPAIIMNGGVMCWFKNGKLHRKNGPAIFYYGGDIEWYKNGKLHREDGPAEIRSDGSVFWYKNGKLHRDDGPAKISLSGVISWYKDGKLHRDDGPALIDFDNGTIGWYQNGDLYRDDGPAMIKTMGDSAVIYWPDVGWFIRDQMLLLQKSQNPSEPIPDETGGAIR